METNEQRDRRQAWLDGLKAGDSVIVEAGFIGQIGPFVVESRTPSGRIRAMATEFNPDGHERGTGRRARLVEPTPVVLAALAMRKLRARLASVCWDGRGGSGQRVTDDQVRAVAAVLWPAEGQP